MKPLKLRTKLTLIYAAVFTLLLAGVSALFYNLLEYQLDKALAQELTERADALRGYLRFEGDRSRFVYDSSDPDEASFVTTATRYFQIYDAASGALIARSPEMEAMRFQYTPEGGAVEVGVRTQGGEAILEVIDNGVGITHQALPHVFERFYRGDPSRSRETEGTGLGLSLVEWIVREHRGRVGVESRPGKGSIFRITFPLAPHKSEPVT
jgi:hypothetical protein